MTIYDLETPALILERRDLEENMRRMDQLLAPSPMSLYPHYKSHKCPALARLQLDRGAQGITCAKLGEAEDLAQSGVETIVLANQVVQPEKIARLAQLANTCRLTVCADDRENVLALSAACLRAGSTLGVLVEYEVGMQRCGVESYEDFLALAQTIDQAEGLRFEGIQAYAGHLAHERDGDKRRREILAIEADVKALKDYVEQAGLIVRHIGGGSTGTAADKPAHTVYTQLQCGSYLFMDTAYQALDLPFRQALHLLTTVVSAKPGRVVVDAGVKSLAMDQTAPAFPAFPGAQVIFSEEHTTLLGDGVRGGVGDKVLCVPGHCCTTVNLARQIYLVDGEDVLAAWPVTSRGKAQ